MKIFAALCFLICPLFIEAQVAISISAAKRQGLTVEHLDSVYKSAIHAEADKAVFKTDKEREKLALAYRSFLIDFGSFLSKNSFKWDETTRGWNRIYMQPDGTIDYFLYSVKNLIPAKEAEFERLLNLYIKDNKFGLTAPVKFAQCSSVTYPKSE